MVLGLQYFDDRADDGSGRPRLDSNAGEELMHVEPRVAIALASRPQESHGTLFISTKRVIWLSDTDKGKGYTVDFLSISLHAVSRDPEAYPLPCIYAQIETEDGDNQESDSDLESGEDLELSKISEMRLVPSDPGQLDTLFEIFCQCAELNPEPHEGGEENSWFFGDREMVDNGEDSEWQVSDDFVIPIGHANGDHDLACSVRELEINDQRFQDADEAEHDSPDERQ